MTQEKRLSRFLRPIGRLAALACTTWPCSTQTAPMTRLGRTAILRVLKIGLRE